MHACVYLTFPLHKIATFTFLEAGQKKLSAAMQTEQLVLGSILIMLVWTEVKRQPISVG